MFARPTFSNTNRNTDRFLSLEYYDDIYQLNFSLLNPLVDTNMNIPMINTEVIVVGKEEIKKAKQYDDV
jgi:hypothetical protein